MNKIEKLQEIPHLEGMHKFCSVCGDKMSLRKFLVEAGFDKRTGEKLKSDKTAFVWACAIGTKEHDWVEV